MSDALNAAADALREKMGSSGFDGSIKFEMPGEGVIRIADGEVSTEDGDADCTITAELETFQEMFEGELDPTAAYMTGKIKIDGDMGVAMKIGQVLA
ncbi:MAG: SCP2 sterol-binding domain-containing protein [Pseudomonadota bacterium]